MRAVDGVARGHLLPTGLQHVAFGHAARRRFQDGKDGADHAVDIDIAGAVDRIKNQQVFAAGKRINLFHFFRYQRGHMSAPASGFQHHVIGDDIELFLYLALDVFLFECACQAVDGAGIDGVADIAAGISDGRDELAQGLRSGLFGKEPGKRLQHGIQCGLLLLPRTIAKFGAHATPFKPARRRSRLTVSHIWRIPQELLTCC